MKNIIYYYLAILLPIPLLASLYTKPSIFVALLIGYVFYRGFVDGQRLIEKNIIDKKDLWKNLIIPFWSSRYYRQLYFEK